MDYGKTFGEMSLRLLDIFKPLRPLTPLFASAAPPLRCGLT